MTGLEYGVRWASATAEFVAGAYTESGARSMVAHCGDPRTFSPHAVEVMVRDTGPWRRAGLKDASNGAKS